MNISFADTSDLLSWNLDVPLKGVYIFGNHLITTILNYNLKTYCEINDIPNKLRNYSIWHAAIVFFNMKCIILYKYWVAQSGMGGILSQGKIWTGKNPNFTER